MSGLDGYIDQLETEAREERRAKKLRDRLRIQTVSSDDDSDETTTDDDWEDCSIDSDDSEFKRIFQRYLVNQVNDSDCSDDSDIFRRYAANQMYDSDEFGVDEDGRSFYVKNGYRMYSDGEYEYEYERAVYWD